MNFDKTTTAETPLIRIVDDEERMRESLAFMLKHEGFECCVYPTAESFLKGDTPSRPGCLLLDVQMDGMTGLELQEEMIRRGITLPIVFLSAHGDLDILKTVESTLSQIRRRRARGTSGLWPSSP